MISINIFFRMARTRLNGSFQESDFMELATEDLIITLWNLNYYKRRRKICFSCEANQNFIINILKERWQKEWGEVNEVLEYIKNCNVNFIDVEYF